MLIILPILNYFIEIFITFYVPSTDDLDFIKSKNKDTGLSSFPTYNNNVPQHLSKE